MKLCNLSDLSEVELYKLYWKEANVDVRKKIVGQIGLASYLIQIACEEKDVDVALIAVRRICDEEMLRKLNSVTSRPEILDEIAKRI